MAFPGGSVVKIPPVSEGAARDERGEDPWVGKIPWRREWQPLQYSCLENSMNRGAWQAPWGHQRTGQE